MTDTKQTTEITIVLPRDLAVQLAQVAKEKGRAQEVLASAAVAAWLEDLEDIAEIQRVLSEKNPSYSIDEAWAMLELDG